MDNFNFSKGFLDFAYTALVYSACSSDHDKKIFEIVNEVCSEHGITLRQFLEVTNKISDKIAELEATHDNT